MNQLYWDLANAKRSLLYHSSCLENARRNGFSRADLIEYEGRVLKALDAVWDAQENYKASARRWAA